MSYVLEKQPKKFAIGVPIRTSNEHFVQEVPLHWEKFYSQNLAKKIPNKLNQELLAVYTDYEKDYTKPFTYIIACEVLDLKKIPTGMRGLEIHTAQYAVFTAKGPFPQALGETWHGIWKTDLKRSYTTDFEIYRPDFNPKGKPEIKVYIAVTK